MSFLDGYGSGQRLAYDIDEEEANSELRARDRDTVRRAEIARRGFIARQRKREQAGGPEFSRAGLAMPRATEAPVPTPTAPATAPDSGLRLGRRRGGPWRNDPDPVDRGTRDNESVISRGARVQRGDADYPLREPDPTKTMEVTDPRRFAPKDNEYAADANGYSQAPRPPAVTLSQVGLRATGGNRTAAAPTAATANEALPSAIASALGSSVTSARRTPEHNRRVGGAPNSMHVTGEGVDIAVPNAVAGMGRQQAEDYVRQQLAQAFPGQAFSEVIHEGDHIHIGWRPEGGQTSAPTQSSGAGAIEQVFDAVRTGPEGLPYMLQQLQDERYVLEDQRAAALEAGIADMVIESSTAIRELNTRTVAAYGAAAATDIRVSGNTELFSAYVREVTGRSLTFQPFNDGTYQPMVDGQVVGPPMSREELEVQALSMVDAEYRQRNAETTAEASMAEFESGLRRRENYETAMFENMTRTEVARIEAEARRTTGANDVEFQDLENADGGSDTVMIYTNPETGQRVMRRVAIEPRRSPSVRGNGAEVPTLVTGTEVPVGG